jgi:hypothetical protein
VTVVVMMLVVELEVMANRESVKDRDSKTTTPRGIVVKQATEQIKLYGATKLPDPD